MDLTRILDFNRPEKPTALLDRLHKFLPEIATANNNLSNAAGCDIKIFAVEDESDASSSTDSDEESETITKQPQIVMDVTTLVEDAPSRMIISDSDSDLDDDKEQKTLPVGFRTGEPMRKKSKRKRQYLMEEVAEEDIACKDISNDQKIVVEQEELNTKLE
ncbi:hypothetical protein LOAG_11461 [Loa loa]|uniref:ATRX n=1 Tax=Loa loa TaxID=7209 RepID=A0A1I7W336_LOALO|nr:hypothetical protein LOAG_11461 [Loa loa]EFO17043.1 hypothetical protein LOAG_11461 [Loa loa]